VISICKLFSDVAGGGSFGVEVPNTGPGRIRASCFSFLKENSRVLRQHDTTMLLILDHIHRIILIFLG
jgi:hypothetical protein